MLTIFDAAPEKEYRITAAGVASAPQLIAFDTQDGSGVRKIILQASGDNIIFKFGDNAVAASKTITNNELPDGNFRVPQGAIYSVYIRPTTQKYVSVIAEGAGGTAIIDRCALPI